MRGTQQFHQSLAPVLIAAAVGLSGVALWLQWRWMLNHGGLLFVLLTTGTAIAATWQASADHALCHRFAAPKYYAHCMTISMALLLLTMEWGIARMFNSLSWMTPVVLTAIACLSYQVGRLYR